MSHFPVFYDANGKALAIFARICYTIGRYFNFFGAFMIKNITLNGQTITYDLQRKKVKNINLRMKRTGEITVSANPRVPDAIIEGFLCEHADRILRAIDQYEKAKQNAPSPMEYTDGETVSVFGERKTLRLLKATKNGAAADGDTICLSVKDTDDRALRQRTLQTYLDMLCRERITALCHQYHPFFEAEGVPFPTIRFRHMTSRWGSCHTQKAVVTFNLALIDLPLAFAEYVVVHELTHLIHPDHSKRFYDRLAMVLPDWKERRRLRKRL